jgi:hypothetical protein
MILTSLALRHAEVLSGAIFHEPPYAEVTSSTEQIGTRIRQLIGDGMVQGGPPMAMELFLRWVAGDETFQSLAPDFRTRLLANGEVFFGLEMEGIVAYLPTLEQLARVRLPCVVAAGEDNRDPGATHHWLYEASQWLANGLRVPFVETPGAHLPQATHPRALVERLRPILGKLAASQRIDT